MHPVSVGTSEDFHALAAWFSVVWDRCESFEVGGAGFVPLLGRHRETPIDVSQK